MEPLFTALFVLFVILAVITVVGHGIWVLLSLIFTGGRKRLAEQQKRLCPFCTHATSRARTRCDWCGRDLQGLLARELEDLDALQRQLRRFGNKGALKEQVVENLLARVQRYRQQLFRPAEDVVTAELVEERKEVEPPPVRPAAHDGAGRISEAMKRLVEGAEEREETRPTAMPVAKPQAAAMEAAKPEVVTPRVAKPPEPPVPRKSFGEMLAAFMEERNIRWGELVGGLLIVGSSIALVLSLWSKIEAIPYSPFLIFATSTSAIFGVGLYAHHRWKLEATSHVLLIIAIIMVPLNFLVMAGFRREGWTLFTLFLEVVSLAVFAWLVNLAARVVVPNGRRAAALVVLAVLGNSAMVLLAPRLVVDGSSPGWVVFSGCLPAAVFVTAVWGYLLTVSPKKELDTGDAAAMLTHVGTAFFALATAFGLVVWLAAKEAGLEAALDCLSAPLALTAFPLAVSGLRISRGMTDDDTVAGYCTTGTTIALIGMSLQVVALGLAWPQPLGILVVGAVNAAGLVYLAFRYRFPPAHAGAMASAAIAYLAAFHFTFDPSLRSLISSGEGLHRYMLGLTVSARSGTALAGMFVLFGLVSEWLARRDRREDGKLYAAGAGVVAVLGLMLVTMHGLFPGAGRADVLQAAILFGIYGAGSLALVARWQRAELSYFGLGLLAAASLWLLWYFERPFDPLWATILGAEALAMGAVAAVLYRLYPSEDPDAWKVEVRPPDSGPLVDFYRVPLLQAADVLATLTIGLAVIAQAWHVFHAAPADYLAWLYSALTAACIAALYLLLACGQRSPQRFTLHQVMLAAAALLGTTAWLIYRQWQLPGNLLNPHCLHVYGIVLGVFALTYTIARIVLRGHSGATSAVRGSAIKPRPLVAPNPGGGGFWQRLARPTVAALWANSEAASQRLPREDKVFSRLLDPDWLPVDWIVRHVVIWLMLTVVVSACLLPGVWQELLPRPGTVQLSQLAAGGPNAWILLAVLAAAMIVALWEHWGREELIGTLLLAAVLACLIAGQFAGSLAVASAARWGLAAVFALGSIAVWNRKYLLAWCRQTQTRVDAGPHGARAARITLLATTAGPVLGLTLLAALLQLTGTSPSGPQTGTLFDRLGPNISYIVPLLLVMLAMVGHAIRERSGGYAFAGGLVAEIIVILGYALRVTLDPTKSFGAPEFATLFQLATITAAVWAAAWLVVRRRLNIWREEPAARSARIMMNVQIGMGAAGNLVLIGIALLALTLTHPFAGEEWITTAGNPLGWIALILVVAAATYRRIQAGKALRPQMVGLVGMTAIGLLACSVTACADAFGYEAAWGYRTLMLGWAMYALLIVSATWWVASQRTLPEAQGPPQALIRLAAVWVRIAGILAVLLGLKAALLHAPLGGNWEDMLWAAVAISIASLAGAAMAVWRRREGWAFSAALGGNVAASLLVWYVRRADYFEDWWLQLLQANVIASAAVALVWLAVRKRLYELRELRLGESPLLAIQAALPVLGNIVVLMVPVIWLLGQPQYMEKWMVDLAQGPGWIALLLATAAAAWYMRQTLPGNLVHVLAGLGLGAGVLIACHTGNFTKPWDGRWLEYNTLIAAWTAVAGILLALGILGRRLRLASQDATPGSSLFLWKASSTATGPLLLPGVTIQAWVTVIGAAVLWLSVTYAHADFSGLAWHFGAMVALSLMAGVIAVWGRRPAYVFVSGLLLNIIGTVAWWHCRQSLPVPLVSLVQVNAICLAVASIAWSLLDFLPSVRVPHARFGGRPAAFAHLAVQAGLALLFGLAAVLVLNELADMPHLTVGRLGWIALLATAAALAIGLWDRRADFTWAGFYFLGLATLGTEWVYRDFLSGKFLAWASANEVAGFVLAAGALGWALPKMRRTRTLLRIPGEEGRWLVEWFAYAQAFLAAVAAGLAIWISIDYSLDGTGSHRALFDLTERLEPVALFGVTGRRAGPSAALMLVGAAIVMAWQTRGRWRAGWQYAALAAGVLLSSSLGWMSLDATEGTPTGDFPWLHRSVNLMVSAAMVTLLAGFGLAKIFPAAADWIVRGRRAVPWLGGLALAMLAVILVQEISFVVGYGEVRMTHWAVLIVAAALAGLAAGCIAFAVTPRWDPLSLSDRGRTAYVYVAEALVALTCLHLGLTRWYWFDFGIIREYWMLIVMAAAFGGVGLSEWFHRRSLPVLSEPLERTALLLPLVPATGFWFECWLAPSQPIFSLCYDSPAMWLVVGMFYGWMAVRRQSIVLAGTGILAANMGFWVLWHRLDWHFTEHPQLWLIPVALITLVAEQLDRRRLGASQRVGIRYVAMSVIYVSSTFEFMQWIGESILPTLITVALAVLGVLAGIFLRVRSFLYLGFACLSVVIVRLIYYGAIQQGQMWLLWSCLIILGLAIIAMFAVFEKRSNDVLAAVERFKQWEE